MQRLQNKIAVVTGGNSGIGYATAERFAREGATVIITGRDEAKVSAAAEQLGVEGIVADQSRLDHIDRLVDAVRERHGRVDVLFVNAGVFFPSPVGGLDEQVYDITMAVNVKGAMFTLEKFLPLLSEGASVINLSSVNAYTGMANTSVYAASKAALNSYTRTAATELAPRRIRVNAVNPGPIETPIFGKSGLPAEMLQGFAAAMAHRVPLKRFGTPEAVANLVTFLASDEAWFITGAEYNVDGGININPGPMEAAPQPAEAVA
jgi:NAD(P)-dependent dehydrogenase (short-subunit alcohol dehydrogenase family)